MEKRLVIHTEKVNKYFREPVEHHVLKDINIDVREGEFVSIMGKSGSGKSTLLYILSTLDTDYSGRLHLNGRLVTGLGAEALAGLRNGEIGFVFQFHYLLAEFTVVDNITLPARKLARLSTAEIQREADELMHLLGIEHLARKPAAKISGGEKQRVAIARALINSPAIIMGDEPTGNLDSKNAENVLSIFRQLSASRGLTLLVVTHDQDFADQTDRTITLEDGQVIAPG